MKLVETGYNKKLGKKIEIIKETKAELEHNKKASVKVEKIFMEKNHYVLVKAKKVDEEIKVYYKYKFLKDTYIIITRTIDQKEIKNVSIDSAYQLIIDFENFIDDDPYTIQEQNEDIKFHGYDSIFNKSDWTQYPFGRYCLPLSKNKKYLGYLDIVITKPDYNNPKRAEVRIQDVIQSSEIPDFVNKRA